MLPRDIVELLCDSCSFNMLRLANTARVLFFGKRRFFASKGYSSHLHAPPEAQSGATCDWCRESRRLSKDVSDSDVVARTNEEKP